MKYFILIFSASLILAACNKKTDEPKVPSPDTTTSDVLKNAIDHLDKNVMKTHKGAINALINLPGAGPIPPHMLPVKDVKLIDETDSTATYSFTSEKTGSTGKVKMRRTISGQDTSWTGIGIQDAR